VWKNPLPSPPPKGAEERELFAFYYKLDIIEEISF
jgi:hypothetical protein